MERSSEGMRCRRVAVAAVLALAVLGAGSGCRRPADPPPRVTVNVGDRCGGPLAHADTTDGRAVMCAEDLYGIWRWTLPPRR